MVSTKTQINPNPFSYITLSWLTPLLVIGKKNALVEDDLPELADKDKSEAINVKFHPYWKQLKDHFNGTSKPKPSLAQTLFSVLSVKIIAINLLAGCGLATALFIPYVLQQLIIYVDPTQKTSFLNNSGIAIAVLLFGLQLLTATITTVEQSIKRRISQVLRSAIIGAIYEKSLRLSPKSQMLFTEGKVMNLVNQDTVNLLKAPTFMVQLWISCWQYCCRSLALSRAARGRTLCCNFNCGNPDMIQMVARTSMQYIHYWTFSSLIRKESMQSTASIFNGWICYECYFLK